MPTRHAEVISRVRSQALVWADEVYEYLDTINWSGPDPYDALTSPIAPLFRTKWSKQAVVQVVKRSPINLRPLLAIPPLRTATACGHAATACARVEDDEWRERARKLASLTVESQLGGDYSHLWGYEFDVQTRWGFYPANSPNIVATAFAVHGILDGGNTDPAFAQGVGTALLQTLYNGSYFTYTPKDQVLIHNANLLGASVAARLSNQVEDQRRAGALREAADRGLEVSLSKQNKDGSWPYGDSTRLRWVDGFHTGYVLLSLDRVAGELGLNISTVLQRGAAYYFENLFSGYQPLYYANRIGPKDPNNLATALRMAVWGAQKGFVGLDFVEGVLGVLRHDDLFLYGFQSQLRRKLVYPRWAAAPLLDALTASGAIR